jgi:hypothetical protein
MQRVNMESIVRYMKPGEVSIIILPITTNSRKMPPVLTCSTGSMNFKEDKV